MTGHKHEIIDVDSLLKKMRAGVRETHEIKLRNLVIPVRVLSLDETNDIRRDAYKQAMINKGDDLDKNVITQRTVLKMASNLDGAPVLSDKLLAVMTTDETTFLYNEYVRVCELVNPNVEQISDEDFKKLVLALKKNIITASDCSLLQLRAICTAYADLIQRQESPASHPAS